MIVICLEGCHGCGKTELCASFERAGYCVLDEAFLDMPQYALHPQTLLMETTWVCAWFTRLLEKADELKAKGDAGEPVFIADRSAFSAVYYSRNGGHLLEPIIRKQMEEVCEAANIHIFTILLKVDRDLLWSRINERLKREPSRVKYHEDKRSWMDDTVDFYESFKWDLEVENNDVTIPELREKVVAALMERSARFSDETRRRASSSSSPSVPDSDSDSVDALGGGGGGGGGGDSGATPVAESPTKPLRNPEDHMYKDLARPPMKDFMAATPAL